MFATDIASRMKRYPQIDAIKSDVSWFKMRSRIKCNSSKVENSFHLNSFLRSCQSRSIGFNTKSDCQSIYKIRNSNAKVSKHFSSSELKEKYLKSQNSVETRRWHLLWKISLGWTIKNSAITVGCSYPYAQKILCRYNLNGEEGVKNRKNQTSNHVRGKKKLLSQLQFKKLTRVIENKPLDGGIWTGTKVARWIETETGKEKVWNQRGWDYLKKCGYSWQSPRPTHKKADKLEQEIFKANLPLKVKKLEQENSDVQIDLWFFDEHRI